MATIFGLEGFVREWIGDTVFSYKFGYLRGTTMGGGVDTKISHKVSRLIGNTGGVNNNVGVSSRNKK